MSSSPPPLEGKTLENNHLGALLKAIKSADICVFFQTPDLIYRWVENLPKFLEDKWRPYGRDLDFFDAEKADMIENKKLQVLATGKCETIEIRFEHNGQAIWYNFSFDCERDAQGAITGLITTGVNISLLRRREQILKVLLREVCHRTKNLLAIIQSIATQTARFSGSIDGFMKKFRGRLQSLSHSQDLVTYSNWTGAAFKELIYSQAKSAISPENENFIIEGEDAYLVPGAALHIGLAFHELFINSLSFGALSQNEGKVRVYCEIKDIIKDSQTSIVEKELTIIWQEIFDPAKVITPESTSRFGSIVLETIVPTAVCGQALYTINTKGVLYELKIPQSQFDLIY